MNSTESIENLPILVWDTCAIAQAQARYLVECGESEDEDKAFQQASADSDLYTFEWESLLDALDDVLKEINPAGYWRAHVANFGWRQLDGYKVFRARDGKTLLQEILPETDCTFRLYRNDDKTIRIQNFHHDSPTGNEWYTLYPVAEEDYDLAA